MTTDQDSSVEKVPAPAKPELHKPPILLFLLPLVLVIVYAALTR